jgi:hypothetical protein
MWVYERDSRKPYLGVSIQSIPVPLMKRIFYKIGGGAPLVIAENVSKINFGARPSFV